MGMQSYMATVFMGEREIKLFFILNDYTTVLWYTVGTLSEREKGTRNGN